MMNELQNLKNDEENETPNHYFSGWAFFNDVGGSFVMKICI
jgi:hypothetical protein